MAEYSREDANRAKRIVERLVDREREGLDLEPDVVVSDVESNARTFVEELSLLERLNVNVPSLVISGEAVPVSLQIIFGGFGGRSIPWGEFPPMYYDFIYEALRGTRKEGSILGLEPISREEARATFLRRAADFVATRIAAIRGYRTGQTRQTWSRPSLLNLRQFLGGPQIATPGCQFIVSTNSGGLRVFWSGAYYVTPNYFNHPTTPTSSILQSGTYIFGVDGGAYGNNIQWELNAVVSLPGLPQVHLNF